MKILIYSPTFYPNIGGIEILTFNLAKSFQTLGHEVVVVTTTNSDGSDIGVIIIRNPSFVKMISYYNWADVFYMPNLSLKITWLLFANPFKKWVISHNTWYFDSANPNFFSATIKQLFFFKATNISVSNIIAKSIWAKSTVIHNCYDDTLFKNLHLYRDKDFLFIGRLVSVKGCLDLVQAFSIVLKSYPNSQLTIVGNGPEEVSIRSRIKELQVNHAVKFLGSKLQNELVSILNEHKCLVVPSTRTEAFGIVVLEGLASGCTVLTSDSTGLVEAGNKYSILFKASNIVDMANQMMTILVNSTNKIFIDDELCSYLEKRSIVNVSLQYVKLFIK